MHMHIYPIHKAPNYIRQTALHQKWTLEIKLILSQNTLVEILFDDIYHKYSFLSQIECFPYIIKIGYLQFNLHNYAIFIGLKILTEWLIPT